MARIDIQRRFDWDTFVTRYWNQRPVLYEATGVNPFMDTDVFDAALGASRGAMAPPTALEARTDVQFTIDQGQPVQLGPWLPRDTDGSLDGYDSRLADALGTRRYALIISLLHSHGFGLWSRERAFFSDLWRRVGLPLSGGITTLFHGNYEHSPVGVHLDRFTTFLFAIRGRKRMRFWARRPWSMPVTTLVDYAPYLAKSFTAEVGPGDILYWPASYYHVGESASRDVATSVNVGIPVTGHQARYDVEDLVGPGRGNAARARDTARGRALVPGVLDGDGVLPRELPAALRQAANTLRENSRDARTQAHIRTLWLNRRSAGGFEPPPPPARRRPLEDTDILQGNKSFPILLEKTGTGWCCSANGNTLHVSGLRQPVNKLVATLNTARTVSVGELLHPFPSRGDLPLRALKPLPATRAGMRRMLEILLTFRAIQLAGR
ncbi:cupin domain-containing protein [Myxococcus sp. AB056]|uniref:JmjC domain-containing protein n=1 Tax=Myxococcus sp. AB056 TaxID=2562792 RepID=UPI001146C6DB|nr:cupin domain-containing protein [Myxococcus sp. AB056]